MTKYPPVKTTLILNEVTQNQLDELSKSEFTSKSQYLRNDGFLSDFGSLNYRTLN